MHSLKIFTSKPLRISSKYFEYHFQLQGYGGCQISPEISSKFELPQIFSQPSDPTPPPTLGMALHARTPLIVRQAEKPKQALKVCQKFVVLLMTQADHSPK